MPLNSVGFGSVWIDVRQGVTPVHFGPSGVCSDQSWSDPTPASVWVYLGFMVREPSPTATMQVHASAVRLGFWSSAVILVSGVALLLGIVASALLLPSAMTTTWAGMAAYADAYRATGGIITALSFLAALVACPAYVIQVISIHGLEPSMPRIRRWLGAGLAGAFASLAGLNYVAQLTIVRLGILSGQTQGLENLVFQNPDSVMLELDFAGWFFLGLAFLTVVPVFREDGVGKALRWILIANATLGFVLLANALLHIPAIGEVLLVAVSVVLLCAASSSCPSSGGGAERSFPASSRSGERSRSPPLCQGSGPADPHSRHELGG